jgi:hypothetical protein
MIPVGMGAALLVALFRPASESGHSWWLDAAVSILLTIIIWEGNHQLNCWFNRTLRWDKRPLRRAIIQGLINIALSITIIYLVLSVYDDIVCSMNPVGNKSIKQFGIVVGTMVSVILQAILIGSELFAAWKASIIEAERYKKEAANSELQMLKGQINPHFLFNNLSVLNSLIEQNASKASEFTTQFAKVYRHLLNHRNTEMTTLDEELELVHAYCFLLKIRFGLGLTITISCDEKCRSMLLPPLSLQILLENCIQHNIITEHQPLNITILASEYAVCISNNLLPKTNAISGSGLGQRNISLRLKPFTDRTLEVMLQNGIYSVKVPLLQGI